MSNEVILVLTMVYSFTHGKSVYFETDAANKNMDLAEVESKQEKRKQQDAR